jgi:hypothetical protein
VAFQNAPVPGAGAGNSAAAPWSAVTIAAARPEVSSLASTAAAHGPPAGAMVTVASCPASSARSWPGGRACGGSDMLMPSRAGSRRSRGRSSSRRPAWTGSRLSRLHTPSRSRLASTSVTARSASAAAPTYSTAPPSAWAMVRTPCRAASAARDRVLSPLPRRMTSGIRPGWLTSARAGSWPGTRTSWIIAGSSPAWPDAGAMTSPARDQELVIS